MEQQTEITAKLDTAELAEAWAKKKGAKPRLAVWIQVGARTNLGRVRENNEDKFECFEPEEPELLAVKGSLYAVADGMGGHASGQIASELALDTITKSYYGDPSDDVEASLSAAIRAANLYVYDVGQSVPERSGMGTTCTLAVIRDDDLYIGQVGDSRAYLVREGQIRQITQDHSWVAEQVQRGAMTEEEAMMSPFRNVITRSLGAAPDVLPDVFVEKLHESDIIVLCSDGLTGYVSDAEILEFVCSSSPAVAAMKLVDLANEHGGGDNVTLVIIGIRGIEKYGRRSRFRKLLGRQ